MIKIKPVDDGRQHFLFSTDIPCRVEVSVNKGLLIAFAYEGTEVDMDQEPCAVYDGDVHLSRTRQAQETR